MVCCPPPGMHTTLLSLEDKRDSKRENGEETAINPMLLVFKKTENDYG